MRESREGLGPRLGGCDKVTRLRNNHMITTHIYILVEMLQHLWASGSSQTLDYIFIPAASKECQQKKSIILQKYGVDTSYLRESGSTGCV